MLANDRNEEWRPVVGYEGIYSVSSLGRVRRDLQSKGATAGKIVSQCMTFFGYKQVSISNMSGKRSSLRAHVLVAEAFIGPRTTGFVVNHKNGVKCDNRAENLEYCTNRQNIEHYFKNTRQADTHGKKKLTRSDAVEIKRRLAMGCLQQLVADDFGIDRRSVSKINTGRTWKCV